MGKPEGPNKSGAYYRTDILYSNTEQCCISVEKKIELFYNEFVSYRSFKFI